MINKEVLKETLRALGFSADLPERVLDELATVCAMVDFPEGSTIFQEGAENHFLFVIQSGKVGLDMYIPSRGRVRILSVGPGEMLAWSALLGEGRMTATAVAVEDTRAVAASAKKLRELCETNHEVGYQLMSRMAKSLSQRLVATRLQLLDLFADSAVTHSRPRS